MFDIHMPEVSDEFIRCFHSAGEHIWNSSASKEVRWIKDKPLPPFLEHLSFLFKNQLFFIQLVDEDDALKTPGTLDGLITISSGCNGHPCLLPMKQINGEWRCTMPGWGLIHAVTKVPISPPDMVTEERIKVTPWELQDFAVQVVRNTLITENRKIISWNTNPEVQPSLWFVGDQGPEWVIVKPVLYPARDSKLPENLETIQDGCSHLSARGNFAVIGFASLSNPYDDPDPEPVMPAPLYRGEGADIAYEGLKLIPLANKQQGSTFKEARTLGTTGVLKIFWSDWLNEPPEPIPKSIDLQDKVEGMMLGLAIGDSLGNTSESMTPRARQNMRGLIEDYLPNRHAGLLRVGLPSDDTQMAFWTLEHLLEERHIEPIKLAAIFAQRQIFGMGKSVREFVGNFESGVKWPEFGAQSAGNGALMRIAPVLIPYLRSPSRDLWADTLLAAHITHDDLLSNVSCVAFVDLLWRLISRNDSPEQSWWLDTFSAVSKSLELGINYKSRAEHPPNFSGSLTDLLRDYVRPAIETGGSVTDACETWHSGAYLLETVPSVIYILARHGHDPRAAILAAVNETKDNDTIAAIVGAAVGALHGKSKLPQGWIDGLLGRTSEKDDGRVFELLEKAKVVYGILPIQPTQA